MALLQWFNRKKPADEAAPSSGHDHHEVEVEANSRRAERTARRELLYAVVRECMVKASVLSSQYRFKVLSLDKRGRQSLLMIDLEGQMPGGASQLAEIDKSITEMAKARHQLVVKAVYWRQGGVAALPTLSTRHAPEVAEKGTDKAPEQPAEAPARSAHDPIDADEVAAFRKALASGRARPVVRAPEGPSDGQKARGPQSYTLLTGFEDTELRDERHGPALSTTQPGDLQ